MLVVAIALLSVAASCKHNIIEDSSAFALKAGQSTIVLGGCQKPMELGFSSCQLVKGKKLPTLELFFMNPASYAVSDCNLNILKTGSIDSPGFVQVDLTPLESQIQTFCILKVEAVEKYPDTRDPNQLREIPFAGGLFIEFLPEDYFPVPTDKEISWCYKVSGTNKGRRKIEACK